MIISVYTVLALYRVGNKHVLCMSSMLMSYDTVFCNGFLLTYDYLYMYIVHNFYLAPSYISSQLFDMSLNKISTCRKQSRTGCDNSSKDIRK